MVCLALVMLSAKKIDHDDGIFSACDRRIAISIGTIMMLTATSFADGSIIPFSIFLLSSLMSSNSYKTIKTIFTI